MTRIFISYRRADSADITGRIDDRLTQRFGRKNIFRDTESIAVGDDFIEVLRHEVFASDVMLVVIGKEWASIKSSDGIKRLEIDSDFVRIEVETALRLPSIRVIPVLVNGAKMPSADELPSTLEALTHRNGVEVRNEPDFGRDVDALVKKIESVTNIDRRPKNLFQRLPRFIQIVSAFILFITAVASCIFTFISILPETQRISVLEAIRVVPSLSVTDTPQATDSQTPEISNLISQEALRISLRDVANDPRALTIAPSKHGTSVWGYSDVGGGLFALDIATGFPISVWETEDGGDARIYPISTLFENARTSTLHFDGQWLWVGDSRNNRLLAFDPVTLNLMTSYEFGNSGDPIALTNIGNVLWAILQDTDEVVAISVNHELRMTSNYCGSGKVALPGTPNLITNQGLTKILVASNNGNEHYLTQINATNCDLMSSLPSTEAITFIASLEEDIFVVSTHKIMRLLANGDLEPIEIELDSTVQITGGMAHNNLLWLSTNQPDLHAIDLTNNETVFIHRLDSTASSIIPFGVQIWIALENNTAIRYSKPKYIHPGLADIIWQQNTLWLIDRESMLCPVMRPEECVQLNLEDTPVSLAKSSDENFIWIGTNDGSIWHLNLTDYQTQKNYEVPFTPDNLQEVDGEHLWVSDGMSGLIAINLQTNQQINPLLNGFNVQIPTSITHDGSSLWFVYSNPTRLANISFDGEVIRQIGQERVLNIDGQLLDSEANPTGIYISTPGLTYEINPQTGEITQNLGADHNPSKLILDSSSIWGANNQNGFIYQLEPFSEH